MEEVKHIIITGATGFIGQHLLEDLLLLNYHISIITRNPSKTMRVNSNKISILKADLNDVESLTSAFKGADCLVNIAAEVREEKLMGATNISGTKNLIEAALANTIKRIIHISSVGVVGTQYNVKPIEVNEDHLCRPKNEYERTKLESEHLFRKAASENNLNLVILRPSNVFGEHHPKKALLKLFSNLKMNSYFVCTKYAVANFVYVKDVTAVIITFIKQPEQNGVFNVGESVPMKRFIDYMASVMGRSIRVLYIPNILFSIFNSLGIKKLRPLSNAVSYSDTKLRSLMSYPKGVKEGLIIVYNNYRSLL